MNEKMTCDDVLTILYEYLDSEVDGPTESEIDHHLDSCRECFSRMEFERILKKKVVGSVTTETPAPVRNRLESLIKRF